MKVMLVFPPQWTPAMPHLAPAVLAAALRSQGVEVLQRDLNLETYDALLTRDYLEQCIDRLRSAYAHTGPRRQVPEPVHWALEQGAGLAARVEAAKDVFRSPAFFDGERSLAAFMTLTEALSLAALPYAPAHLDLVSFEPALTVDSSRELVKAAADAGRNMLLEVFRRIILPDIVRDPPDLIGISVPTRAQMLPAMTLAHLVRKAGVEAHITLGGPHISMLRGQIPSAPALFALVDSAVVFDGETPLLRLVDALAGDGELARVPNLIYREGDRIRVNPVTEMPKTGRLPDFDGLPLDRYLVPEPVLPLITAHGCYHGRCAFCNVGYGGEKGYHALPAGQVLEQVGALQEKYGVRHIFFADEAIPPRTLRGLAEGLAARGSPVSWCGCARLEPALSEQLLTTMAAGGCRMLLFGLETASERVVRHMRKGTQREAMSRVLRASGRAGVWNHTFFFFGFPTETLPEAQETVNFLYEHQDVLHSASPGVFVLERASPVHADPRTYGVKRVLERPGDDLAIYFDYELRSGLDEELARTLVDRLVDVLPAKRYGQYYLHDAYRFLYASHLQRSGAAYPRWLADEPPA